MNDTRLYVGLLLAGLLPSAAIAQEAVPASQATSLDEVVVTAQRRSENLQSVPIAVSVVSAETLASAGATDITDLNHLAPGLHIQASAGFLVPRIRGIGTTAYGAGLENSIATYVDGVYYASGAGSLLGLNNVAQIDVLKGPQGTLFGRNATGGLIQITTREPSQAFTGQASATYGNYESASASLYLAGGLTDTLAADLAIQIAGQGEGYGVNLNTGNDVYRTEEDFAVRSKWVFSPGPSTDIQLIVDYLGREGSGTVSSHQAPGTKPLFGPAFAGSPWDIDSDIDPDQSLTGGGASLRWEQGIGDLNFLSITAYRESSSYLRFDTDLTPTPALTLSNSTLDDQQFSQEFQIQSGSGSNFQWLAGVYYFSADGKFNPNELTFGGPLINPRFPIQTVTSHANQKTESYAAYGQATFAIGPDTNLTAGLRYTTETRSIRSLTEGTLVGGIPTGPLAPETTDSRDYEKPTWRLALDHKLAEGVLVYASYNRGFKSGGFNAALPNDPPFEPEVLDAYEVGLKSVFLDRRVRLNGAAFFYDYANIQVGRYQNGQIGYYNGASAEIYGADIDIEAHVVSGLTLRAGLSLLHDRFKSFPNAIFAIPRPTGGTQAVIASAEGNRLPLTPDATFNLNINYEKYTTSGTWTVDAGYYANSGWFGQSDNILEQDGYSTFDFALGWRAPDDRIGVRLWGKNLGDEAVASALGASDISSIVQYEAPRTYGLTLTSSF